MQTAAMADHVDEVIKEWDGSDLGMGQPPHDWDVSTGSTGEERRAAEKAAKGRVKPRAGTKTRGSAPGRRGSKPPDFLPPKECYDKIRDAAMTMIEKRLQDACGAFPGMWYTDDDGNVMSIPPTMELRIDDSSVRSTRVRNIASLTNKTVASASSDGVIGFHARALGLAINNLPYGAAGGNYLAVAPKSSGTMFKPKSVLMDALGPGAHKVGDYALLPYIKVNANGELNMLIRYGRRVFGDGVSLDVGQIGMPKRVDDVDIYEGNVLAPSYSDVRAEMATFPICSELAERADAGTTSTRTRTGGVLPLVDGCSDFSKHCKGYGLVLRIKFPIRDGVQLIMMPVTLYSTSWSHERNTNRTEVRASADDIAHDGEDDEDEESDEDEETAKQGITLKTYTSIYEREDANITSSGEDGGDVVTIQKGENNSTLFIPDEWIEYHSVGALGGVLLAERNATMLFPGLNRADVLQAPVVPIPPGGGGGMGQTEFAPEVLLLEKASGELLVTPPERIGGIKSPITLHIILSQLRPGQAEGVQLLSRAVALAGLLHAFCVKERAGCKEWDWDAVDASKVSDNVNVSENMNPSGKSTQNNQWQARCWAAGCLPGKPDEDNNATFRDLAVELSGVFAARVNDSAWWAEEDYCRRMLYIPSMRMFACIILFCHDSLQKYPKNPTFTMALNDMMVLWEGCGADGRARVSNTTRAGKNVTLVNTATQGRKLFSQSIKSVDDGSDASVSDDKKTFTWIELALGWTQEGRVIDAVYNFPVQKAQAEAAQAQAAQAQAAQGSEAPDGRSVVSVFKNLLSSPTRIEQGDTRQTVTDRCGQLLHDIITSGHMTPPALSSGRDPLMNALRDAFKGESGFGHIAQLDVTCQRAGQAERASGLIKQMAKETMQKANPVVGMFALAMAVIPVNDEHPSESALRISAGETVQYTDQTRLPATNVNPVWTGPGVAQSTAIETNRRGRWGDDSPECPPSTSGKAGKGADLPSTSGIPDYHPSLQKVGFRPEDAFLGGDGIPDNVCPGASVAQVLTYALDQAVETCMSLQFLTTSDTARPVRLVGCEGGPEYLECDISMLYRPAALLLPGSESYYRNIVGGGTTVDWIEAMKDVLDGRLISLIKDATGVPTDSKVLYSRLQCVRELLNIMWSKNPPAQEKIAKITLGNVVGSHGSNKKRISALVNALWDCVTADDSIMVTGPKIPSEVYLKKGTLEAELPPPDGSESTSRKRTIQEALMRNETDSAVDLIVSCVKTKVSMDSDALQIIVREVVKVMSDNMTWLRRMADYAIAWGPIGDEAHAQLVGAWTRVATLKRMQKRVEKKAAGADDEPGHREAFINLSVVSGVNAVMGEEGWKPGAEANNTGAGAYFCALLNNLGLKTIGDEARSADANPLAGGKNTAVLIGRTPEGELLWQVYNTIKAGSTGGDYYYIFTNAVQGPSLPASFLKMHPTIFKQHKPPWSWCPQWYSYISDSGSVTIIRAPIENMVPALGTCTESSADLAVPWVTSSMQIVGEVLKLHNKEETTIRADYVAYIEPLEKAINKLLQSDLVINDEREISCEIRANVVAQVANALLPFKGTLKDVLGRVVGSDDPVPTDIGRMREARGILTGICSVMMEKRSPEDIISRVTDTVPPFMESDQQCIAMAIALDEYVGVLAPSMQTVYRMIGRLSSAISSRLPTGSKSYTQIAKHLPSIEARKIFPDSLVVPALRQGYVHESHTAFEQAMVMAPLASQVDVMCVMGNIARAHINRETEEVQGERQRVALAAIGCDPHSGSHTPARRGTSSADPALSQHSNWSDTESAKGSPWNSPSYSPGSHSPVSSRSPGSSPLPGNSPPHMGPLAAASPRSDGYTTPTYAGSLDGTMVDVDGVATDDGTTHAGGGNGFLVTPMLTVPARTRRRNKRGRCRTLKQARK